MATTKIIKVTDNVLILPKPVIVLTAAVNNGMDIEKVVAVAATKEKIAIKSIIFPSQL